MKNNLAIVIPAYKADFLNETLKSIANQTNKDFTLYIGDDNSPFNLYDIIKKYESLIDIVYVKFQNNLGGHDLVEQWMRCINLVKHEKWIWFFSDDDIMEKNCVQEFYETLIKFNSSKLFHFNIKVINQEGYVIREPPLYPKDLDTSTYHLMRWKSKILGYVVEYIFSKDYFNENGGFQNFNHAWYTDEATWTKLGFPEGLTTIENANVLWRRSSVNITPNNHDWKIVSGKLEAGLSFSKWVLNFYQNHSLSFTFLHKYYLTKRFTNQLAKSKRAFEGKDDWKNYLNRQLTILNFNYMSSFYYIHYYTRILKSTIKQLVKR